MPTYAIGDVQGCYRELRSLLRECGFDARRDRLWFVGDLVNRGPASLEVLRFVADLGDRAQTVLGNHDLHLVASARGIRPLRARDTFRDVLDAADGEALVDWLREQPVIHRDPERGFVMVHAGIAPAWTIDDALVHGAELSRALRAPDHPRLLAGMYGNEPHKWRKSLSGIDRLRFITNAFTRMRYCHGDGRLDFSDTDPPGTQDSSLTPWFELRDAHVDGIRIVFGHWATLQVETALPRGLHVRHVDTGCVWGGSLTALRLEDDREFSVGCESGALPVSR
ncbi:MAG: symmetrical bis(5'-nucleosyl)-tetraphosphatase [Chromatiales bacterium]|nr:symmetrical bis(5'-nucleosyl)-tetraphosphatase [Chromatiales bacterium]